MVLKGGYLVVFGGGAGLLLLLSHAGCSDGGAGLLEGAWYWASGSSVVHPGVGPGSLWETEWLLVAAEPVVLLDEVEPHYRQHLLDPVV